MKRNVYITQFNTATARNLLPLAAGLIYSAAKSNETIQKNFNLHLEIVRDQPLKVIEKYVNPVVLAYSNYCWNHNYTVQVAKLAKEYYPDTLIIFGGPSVPRREDEAIEFLNEHPFVDIIVPGEGEIIFSEILRSIADGKPLENDDNISININGKKLYKPGTIKDFSSLPSPFLDGTFDELMQRYGDLITGAVWENNRGCPYKCTYCYWGIGEPSVISIPDERVYAELDWIVRNKINYIFCADANFGILKRDLEIAKYLAYLNNTSSYPKYVILNWAKNSSQRIIDIADSLNQSDIDFMVTASFQSYNPETLNAVKRKNMKIIDFDKTLEEASKRNFHTYSELILGLPLETYESFTNGLRNVLVPKSNYHFSLYTCVVVPGTEMSSKEYVKKYKIQTSRCTVSLAKTHDIAKSTKEYEDIVVATSTMSTKDWKRAYTFGFFIKALYNFRLAFFIFNYLRGRHNIDLIELIKYIIQESENDDRDKTMATALGVLEKSAESILGNKSDTVKLEGVATSLYPDMACLVECLSSKESFYFALDKFIKTFIKNKNIVLDADEYNEVMTYQYAIIPTWKVQDRIEVKFSTRYILSILEREKSQTNYVTFSNSNDYTNADDFLQKHIYSGMLFKLIDAQLAEHKDTDTSFVDASKFFEKIISQPNNEDAHLL